MSLKLHEAEVAAEDMVLFFPLWLAMYDKGGGRRRVDIQCFFERISRCWIGLPETEVSKVEECKNQIKCTTANTQTQGRLTGLVDTIYGMNRNIKRFEP